MAVDTEDHTVLLGIASIQARVLRGLAPDASQIEISWGTRNSRRCAMIRAMDLAWSAIEGSTLVREAAYDPAAQRIFVRLWNGSEHIYDECDPSTWMTFLNSASKGEYLTQTLERRRSSKAAGATNEIGNGPRVPPRGRLLNAFRPAQEIADPKFFSGRNMQILELADALQIGGSCPLIYGDRGLGKSSLAIQGQLIAMGDAELLTKIGHPNRAMRPSEAFTTIFVSCSDEVRNTNALLRRLVNAVEDVMVDDVDGVTHRLVDRNTGRPASLAPLSPEGARKFEFEMAATAGASLKLPERLQRAVRLLTEIREAPVLLIIDELDRVRDKSGLASFIKASTSDDLKFLLVGIAQDWSDLLLDHVSLERRIVPIKVPRMTRPDLARIIDLAIDSVRTEVFPVRFDQGARERIVNLAGGFPWFVHVLGQSALVATVDEGRFLVTEDDVIHATRDLVSNRYAQQFADSYQRAVRDSPYRELTLRVFAEWPTADVPTNEAYSALRSMGVSNPAVYRGHLANDKYGSVIMTPGHQERGLVRFRNEMFRRYVLMVPSAFPGAGDRVRESVARSRSVK